ncbi:MAG: 30S ribosomal protein S4 [Nanoarchaeota archaeon]|nr:30S ribosomal protein S4 [Nanoarchaeota archaeon]
MGDIKKLKKKFERPQKPWEKNRIIVERELINKYGYKNKKEVWRFKALLRGFRSQARNIVASRTNQAKFEGENLLNRLRVMGLLDAKSSFDDILELSIDDISKRRLVALMVEKGLARTSKQARQFITHKHVMVGDRKVASPNYIVLKNEENSIKYAGNSPYSTKNHPLIEDMKNVGNHAVVKEKKVEVAALVKKKKEEVKAE